MQGKLADMYVTMNASKSYVYSVAKASDRGEVSRKDAAGARQSGVVPADGIGGNTMSGRKWIYK